MPASIITLLIGLAAGGVIGYLIKALRSKSSGDNSALLEDYKRQLEAERGKTENAIKLTAELTAMKSTVEKLSVQSNEANRIRTEAEAKLETTINEMRRASESIFDETKKIAGALSNSQARGKFGEAQLELLLQSAGLRENHEYTRQKSTTDADSSGIPDITVKMPGGSTIFIDSKYTIYSTGSFNGTTDFDPGKGNYNISAFGQDVFVYKLAQLNVGIGTNDVGGSMSVYPNPSSGVFYLNLSENTDNSRIEVFDARGTRIRTQLARENYNLIDLEDQPNGFYSVLIINNNGVLASQKIIKQ